MQIFLRQPSVHNFRWHALASLVLLPPEVTFAHDFAHEKLADLQASHAQSSSLSRPLLKGGKLAEEHREGHRPYPHPQQHQQPLQEQAAGGLKVCAFGAKCKNLQAGKHCTFRTRPTSRASGPARARGTCPFRH